MTVVDSDPKAFERLGSTFGGVSIAGIGFDRDVLLRAGIEAADGIAAVTGDDEVNAVVARIAGRIFRVPKVVARLYDPGKAHIYRRLGVQVVAPVDWGIHRAADLLTFSDVGAIMSLGTGQVDLVEIDLPPLLDGRPIERADGAGRSHADRHQPCRQDVHPDNGDDHAGRRHRPPRGRRRLARPSRVDAGHEVRRQP